MKRQWASAYLIHDRPLGSMQLTCLRGRAHADANGSDEQTAPLGFTFRFQLIRVSPMSLKSLWVVGAFAAAAFTCAVPSSLLAAEKQVMVYYMPWYIAR